MNKVHFPDNSNDNRSICHTYRTQRRQVVWTTEKAAVTCTRCQAKLSKEQGK